MKQKLESEWSVCLRLDGLLEFWAREVSEKGAALQWRRCIYSRAA